MSEMPPVQTGSRNPESQTAWMVTVIIPIVLTLITGVFVGLLAAFIAGRLNHDERWFDWGLGTMLVTCLFFWVLVGLRRFIALLEEMYRKDLNGDGWIGEPEQAVPAEPPLEVRSTNDDGTQTIIARLPIPRRYRVEVAEGFLRGDLTVRTWTGAGKPFTDVTFAALLTELRARGLVQQKSGKGDLELSEEGRTVFMAYLSERASRGELAREYAAHSTPPPTLYRR